MARVRLKPLTKRLLDQRGSTRHGLGKGSPQRNRLAAAYRRARSTGARGNTAQTKGIASFLRGG